MTLDKTSEVNPKRHLPMHARWAYCSSMQLPHAFWWRDYKQKKKKQAVFKYSWQRLIKGSLMDSSTKGRSNTQHAWSIFGVDSNMSQSKSPWRLVNTLGIGHHIGSNQWGSHHSKSFHLKAYLACVFDALAFRSVFWIARSEFHSKRINPEAQVPW